MATEVTHYGIHWAPGAPDKIAFLHQTRGGFNAIGAREFSPYQVRLARRWLCNHLIALNAVNPARSHLTNFETLVARNSLVRFMLPLPKDADPDTKHGVGIYLTDHLEDDLLQVTLLLKMSSPLKLPIFYANLSTARNLVDELGMTNVQPLVLAGVGARHMALLQDVVQAAPLAPRRLLVLAARDVPPPRGVTVVEADQMFGQDEIDLAALPWETLGAIVLRAYMRGEWEGQWFSREPTPANEAKFKPPKEGE